MKIKTTLYSQIKYPSASFNYLFLVFLIVSSVAMFPAPMKSSISFAFDGAVVFLCLLTFGKNIARQNQTGLFVFCFFSVYLIINFILFLIYLPVHARSLSSGEILNFIYSNKFIFYVAIGAMLCRGRLFSYSYFNSVMIILLFVMGSKYFVAKFLFGHSRPTVFIENNYELMMLALLVLADAIYRKRLVLAANYPAIGVLIVIILLSGSRSAVLCVLPIIFLTHSRLTATNVIIGFVSLILVLIVIYVVFASRTTSLDQIDRFKFFMRLINEIKDFNFWNYLFGNAGLEPLSRETCKSLAFYKNLFSSTGDGRCYALIFHSFYMRAFFDHGLFAIFVTYFAFYKMLKVSGFSTLEILCILFIPSASALSVSSFATPFVALPLGMLCAWIPPFPRDQIGEFQTVASKS